MIHGHTCHKINHDSCHKTNRESYHSSKAQFEGMHVLHFETMFSINNHEPKLGHFYWNLCASIRKDKTITLT
jgi:hypothetical protein